MLTIKLKLIKEETFPLESARFQKTEKLIVQAWNEMRPKN